MNDQSIHHLIEAQRLQLERGEAHVEGDIIGVYETAHLRGDERDDTAADWGEGSRGRLPPDLGVVASKCEVLQCGVRY